jgi:hypothetical protein
MDRNVAVFCTAADRTAANTLANNNGGGPNNFSIPLSTVSGVENPALATHWAGSGNLEAGLVGVLETSVSPLLQVRSNEDKTFDQHLAESTPVLYRINEPI